MVGARIYMVLTRPNRSKPIFIITPVMGTVVAVLVCLPTALPVTICASKCGGRVSRCVCD